MAVQKIMTATLVGINAALVEVEADVSNGLPATIIVGLPDTAVQESRERVRSAIKHSGLKYPQTRVSLNLAPGGLPKVGTHFDVPIALAVMLANGLKPKQKLSSHRFPRLAEKQLFVGELSLDGLVRPTPGVLAMTEAARAAGFSAVFVPAANAAMASLVTGIKIYPIQSLRQLIDYVAGDSTIEPFVSASVEASDSPQLNLIDFANIAGQDHAKRALEIAAAGGHNLLMTGPPGSGKTMLAKALPGILPPLELEEILELTKIYNSTGLVQSGVVTQRPARDPHHTSSSISLIGGGAVPRPGEVTLAHHGVLFLDEFPEFSRAVLEVLRQPLEDRAITITRSRHAYTFPASFILVAAQNPCPCGNFGQPLSECTCHPLMVQRYQKKISGPLLDRIDLHINVPRLRYSEIMSAPASESTIFKRAQTSVEIQQRVAKARVIQSRRFGKPQTNSEMSTKQLKTFCNMDPASNTMLEQASNKYQLSGRSIHRVLKVARTVADLAESENIEQQHVAESLQYRLRDHPAA